jgi:putative ABC transport system permease protein
MNPLRRLLRNLFYHWRGNLAVLLGVAVGTAVLTGALLVGDSLYGSLKERTLEQLGWVDQALVSRRFFREELAHALPAEAVVLLQGSISVPSGARSRATVLGVDGRFWSECFPPPADRAALNRALAEALGAHVGDQITINMQKADAIPRESLLGKRKTADVMKTLTVTVGHILPDTGMSRFSLKPSPETARNIFLPLKDLQGDLKVPGKVNAILVGDPGKNLQVELARHLTLADWNLALRTPEDRARSFARYLDPRKRDGKIKRFRWEGRVPEELAKKADAAGELPVAEIIDYYRRRHNYVSLESGQLFLEPAVVRAAEQAAGTDMERVLVYLADSIADGKASVPYAIVAALDKAGHADLKALGYPLKENEIALTSWPGSPFQARPGDPITVTYYVDDDRGSLVKKATTFTLARFVPLEGNADDPDLTPQFPGITDKLDMGSWENPPFPYLPTRIKQADEDYWKRYRTTPRAYVNLATAQKLWASRFGNLTSLRLPAGNDPAKTAQTLAARLLTRLKPEDGGFVFQPVKKQALKASGGSTDFSGLFLGFSFFLIAAALLLVGLLFRLNLDRRAAEIGLLLAVGFRRRTIRLLLLGEGTALAVVGGGIGLAAAVLYASLLLDFLGRTWPGEQRLTFLRFHADFHSIVHGYLGAVAVSIFTILWATRVLARVSPTSLLAGQTASDVVAGATARRKWPIAWIVISGSAVAAFGFLAAGFIVTGHEAQAGSFFGSGIFVLVALLALTWIWMRSRRHKTLTVEAGALARLGVRNASRHPVRSILTVGLLASATFLVVAVQSFHRTAGADFYQKDAGSGGFRLLAEADVPLFQDLNTRAGKADLFFPKDVPGALEEATVYPFRVRAGDDASCLNLYQPLKPRILGVPEALVERGGFQFKSRQTGQANPWRLLEQPTEDGSIPVFADATTSEYTLHVGQGEYLTSADEQGNPLKLRIVGLLQDSIFQSELLMSDANFKRLFPRQEGFAFFLIDTPPDEAGAVKSALESANVPLFVTPTAKRMESYLAVENTYLATFQALGGLGLLLGALGLAVVLLRSVWERRGELALLRALGFRRRALNWLVLAENGFLLLLGLAVGTLSAFLAVTPHLMGMGGQIDWLPLAGLLALVLLVGLGAATVAVAATLRAPLLTALRRE